MFKQACMLLLLCLILTSTLSAENWPNWRGPRNDGTSTETGLAVQWDQSKNVAWRLPLPGEAAATPVVWGDRIFLTSAEGQNLVVLSVSTDGKMLWKQTAGTGNSTVKGDEGNFAAPSPSTDGKHVFAFFGSGDLVCYDFSGKQIWKTNIAERYGKFNLNFVMASTPLLDRDRLYLQLIHTDAQLVLALDKATGHEIWKQQRSSNARQECKHSYASPMIYRDGKHEFLLIHGADYITAHQLKDGSEIWRSGGLNSEANYNPNFRFVATPVSTAGLIVVPSAKNGPVLGIKPDSKGDITEIADRYHWKLERGTPDVPSPLIHDGIVYLCRENGDLSAFDAKTGDRLYQNHTHQGRHRASPVYADGKIYITARDGVISVVKAGKQFELIAQNKMGEQISASPAISNGTIYLRTFDALYAIRSK